MSTFSGNPLTGSLTGTVNDDIFSATGLEFAISGLDLTDPGGNDQIVAENLSLDAGPGQYGTSAINQSNLRLGDGTIYMRAAINHGYYATGIGGGSLTMGSGDSTLVVDVIEQSTTSFIYQVSGIHSWMLDAGAGDDSLAITVRDSRSETFSDYGILSSAMAFGDGVDALKVDIANSSGAPTSRGISASTIDLGADGDSLDVTSTGYGITNSALDAGAGNDTLIVHSALDAVAESSILMGSGDDAVTLSSGNVNSAELVNGLIDLGTGDDVIHLGRAVNSTIAGGEGTDTLFLAGTLADYEFSILDDRTVITRTDDGNFHLIVQGVEDIHTEGTVPARTNSAEHLTGFLSDPYGLDTIYSGTGLSAAIENLTVIDLGGNDIVRAVNATETGGFSTYSSNGILGSNFTFGDGTITFQSKINQGYYASGVNGGSLTTGDGNSFIDIQAVEDFPADRLGFYYAVTGIASWQLQAGGGSDILNVVVKGHKAETFNSFGLNSGSYDFGDGDDIANIVVSNESGTGEAVAIANVSDVTFGNGADILKALSTGAGVTNSIVDTGAGRDIIDIAASRDVIDNSQIFAGADSDIVFFKGNGGNSADLVDSSVDLGAGDDYVELAFAVNSTIEGGEGYDILRLRGEESVYVIEQGTDGVYHISRTDNALFSLAAGNFENIIYGGVAAAPFYSGSPLTGYLTGTAQGDDAYVGSGLSAAIENLTVFDTKGFNRVVASNISPSGGIESYASHAIVDSNFSFGGTALEFAARINQGYYAGAISGGSLTAGTETDWIDIIAAETSPSTIYGFYYGVTGASGWTLNTGGGSDSLNVRVYAHKSETFYSYGVDGGSYDLGDGDDVISISITNASGTTESVAIHNTQKFDLGAGDDVLTVMSTGLGGTGNLATGNGDDFVAVHGTLGAWSTGTIDLAEGNDAIALTGGTSGHAAIEDVLVNLGSGDDVARIESYRNSTIAGGAGNDTVVLGGTADDYATVVQADGSQVVTSLTSTGQSLTLIEVEEIQYEGVGTAGQAATFGIEGTLAVGGTLAIHTQVADTRGMARGTYSCIWQASADGSVWTDIGAETTLVVGGQLQQQQIRVEVSYFDSDGHLHHVFAVGNTPVQPPSEIPIAPLEPSVEPNTSVYTMAGDGTVADLTGTSYSAAIGNDAANILEANGLGNYLDGGSGNDHLSGSTSEDILAGGDGDDIVDGGSGDDLIIGGNGAGDDVYDGGVGIDTVKYTSAVAAIAVDLALGTAGSVASGDAAGIGSDKLSNIENIIAGNYADQVSGSGRDNRLEGLDGDDVLKGLGGKDLLLGGNGNDTAVGGTGNDTMLGGGGNDTYVVDATRDRVFETTTTASSSDAGGRDTVQSSVSFSLNADAGVRFVERLTLTGTGNINGTGNALNNSVTGNNGSNRLDGGLGNDTMTGGAGKDTLFGGEGNDRLSGGGGADVFVFDTPPNAATNKDTITDFTSGTDHINLAKSVMAALGTVQSALLADAFWQGAGVVKGHDASDRILYNTSTGALYYDSDGNGSGAAVQLAQLGTTASHPATLTPADFFVF